MNKYLSLILLLTTACSSIPKGMNDFERDSALKIRNYEPVLEDMRVKEKLVSDKDLLLHKLNYAMVLHYSGKYKESNVVLGQCQQMVDWGDNTTAQKALGIILSPNVKRFELDEYEILTISLIKMLNALNLGEINNALAESRRLDRVGQLLQETKKSTLLKETEFHTYFSGLIWESQQKLDFNAYDNAYINYKRTFNVHPEFAYLPFDLYRVAYLGNRKEDIPFWDKKYSIPDTYKKFVSKQNEMGIGELVIVFSFGTGPRKMENPNSGVSVVSVPRTSSISHLKIDINGEDRGQTIPVVDFDSLAEKNLKNKWSGVIGTIGNITGVYKDLDTRAWEMIPKQIQLARIVLPEGSHKLSLEVVGDGQILSEEVKITKGRKTLITIHFP